MRALVPAGERGGFGETWIDLALIDGGTGLQGRVTALTTGSKGDKLAGDVRSLMLGLASILHHILVHKAR